MYLMRIGPAGSERPVVLIDDLHYIDVADAVEDFNEAFFGSDGLTRLGDIVRERRTAGQLRDFTGERIGAPIARPHQILCIGLNYSDHAAETGAAIPEEPILFTKSPNTLIGPNDEVRIPRGSTKLDWEVELGVVIKRRTSYLDSVADAHDAIAGYLVVNDVSERAFQTERGGQWSKGKSAETFNPAGPLLVTPDEIDDVLNLRMWLDVGGVRRQDGSTSTMIFDPYFIVHYLSQFLVLEPGDLINTGTPAGVGLVPAGPGARGRGQGARGPPYPQPGQGRRHGHRRADRGRSGRQRPDGLRAPPGAAVHRRRPGGQRRQHGRPLRLPTQNVSRPRRPALSAPAFVVAVGRCRPVIGGAHRCGAS